MATSGGNSQCRDLHQEILHQRDLIIVSNRGPITLRTNEDGEIKAQRSGGGLVTALLGLAKQVHSTWIACAMSDEDRSWNEGEFFLNEENDQEGHLRLCFIDPKTEAYDGYYGVISNPLLWFLQHSIWDFASAPNLNRATWQAWEDGYVAVNQQFANAVVKQVRQNQLPSLIMLQDYHLYLTPKMIRKQLGTQRSLSSRAILTHFIHIPWPGPEDWGLLPGRMRKAILEGLCAVDLIGFQTKDDALNFMRTCETLLPGAKVNYRKGRVLLHNHVTYVRDFPISIDVDSLREEVQKEEVRQFHDQLAEMVGDRMAIVRIDRTDPSKNIVRGFLAYEEMLENHPEHHGKVQFLALLVPSRMDVMEYEEYLNIIMATAGHVNARYGTSEWEPVRVLIGESYQRALAAMQLYDVLLVNPVADGMNLVAKEGPTLNEKSGVVILSERAGAHQQLCDHTLLIAPVDVSATAEALHTALTMPAEDRRARAMALKNAIEREDIYVWLCWQLDALQGLIDAATEKRNLVPN